MKGTILVIDDEKSFRIVVPYLILASCGLLAVQPRLGKWVAARQAQRAGSRSEIGVAVQVGVFLSALKIIPVAGTLFGIASMPIAMAAVTYALGQLFVSHLEMGGTLANFDAAANRRYFKDLVRRGREVASTLVASASSAKGPSKS